jgi:hypothetical protein
MDGSMTVPNSSEWKQAVLRVNTATFLELLPAVFDQTSFDKFDIRERAHSATATRETDYGDDLGGKNKRKLTFTWRESRDGIQLRWTVWNVSSGQERRPDLKQTEEVGRAVKSVFRGALPDSGPAQGRGHRDSGAGHGPLEPKLDKDPILGPGDPLKRKFAGNLRDYSAFAEPGELNDLHGVLPLGRYAFQRKGDVRYGPSLALGRYRTNAPMLYNGVLLCAPQNSGKTSLIVRWARAANRAHHNVFLVDVKGNLYDKLTKRNEPGNEPLQGKVFYFSTDPEVEHCDRINFLSGFLSGPTGFTARTTERIEQLVTAILPSDQQRRRGSEEDFHYRNSVAWLSGLIHLLLLRQMYYSDSFDNGKRQCDLSDLYDWVTDEDSLYLWIEALREAEEINERDGKTLPELGVNYWVREIALLLDPEHYPEGQRDRRFSFREYTQTMVQALRPFSRHGTLAAKISDTGAGKLFRFEDLGSEEPNPPVTIILAAREQDLGNAETVLAMAITRLQHLLFERVRLPKPRPILLLLDETRRIRSFEANRYITYAREAKAGCVIAYQSLDQIGDEKVIYEILENVGTQIYLGSIVGNSARYFINIMPKRYRDTYVENVSKTSAGVMRTEILGKELVDFCTTNELYNFPSGKYPALVYVNDQPRRKPFLVDLDEPSLNSGHNGA